MVATQLHDISSKNLERAGDRAQRASANGSISLHNILFDDPSATKFDLKVTFTSPTGPGSSVFTADFVGLISWASATSRSTLADPRL